MSPTLRSHLLGLLAVVGAVLFAAAFRIETALRDPAFDTARATGLLKSDPALLHYVTERILAAGGSAPADFRSDPRVQHPDVTDIPAEFTVGQEFLVAWCYRAFGGETPLHVFCVRLMALTAALALVGVYLFVLSATRSVRWAVLATFLAVLLPANYRTIGFILIREDVSFPLYALHLGLLAHAVRRPTAFAFLFSGIALAGALATWHAMGFFVALELAVLWVAFLAGRRSPFEVPGSWAVLVGPFLAGLLVPALRESGFLAGIPVLAAAALFVVALVGRRRPLDGVGTVCVGVGSLMLLYGTTALVLPGRSGYSHVYDVLWSKLVHLGELPSDPTELPFDARLLWQGPFETLPVGDLVAYLQWSLPVLGIALVLAARDRARLLGFGAFGLGLALLSLPVAWLFGRTIILPGVVVPAAAAVFFARNEGRRFVTGIFLAALILQAVTFARQADGYRLTWYQPPGQKQEIAAVTEWITTNLDRSEPIAADFVNSTAILAATGNPIVLQPKYETERSRRRAEAFLTAFFHGSPAEFRELVLERFQCRYVVVDRYVLGRLSWYIAGLSSAEPLAGTAAEVLLSVDGEVLAGVPGYELVYRSPETITQLNGEPYDYFRVFALR